MKPLGVTEVNTYIKKIFAGDMLLSDIDVEGEVSNYKPHYSGHLYFSLKDETGRIKCVMFKSYAEKCDIQLIEGQKIIVKGYISVYEKNGDYQLYVRDIIDKGIGQLYRQFEELKLKLEFEGLFKQELKKAIPPMPRKIGVVTSSTGAAVRDIVTITQRRFPACNILIYPSLVQGENAAPNIIDGLLYLDNREDVELIILARGGGSIDELFVFNDEQIARTIFQLETPIISAIGHETDFTIADFVADLRAPTPSAAAELAVPNMSSLKSVLNAKYRNIVAEYRRLIRENSNKLEMIYKSIQYNNPKYEIRNKSQELDMILKELFRTMENLLNDRYNYLSKLEKKLQLLNPIISLEKGNGILLDDSGFLISSIMDVNIEDNIRILLMDGSIDVVVKGIKNKGEDREYGI